MDFLYSQLGHEATVKVSTLCDRWKGVCLQKEGLHNMLKVGRFQSPEIEWLKFLAIAAGYLCPVSLVYFNISYSVLVMIMIN